MRFLAAIKFMEIIIEKGLTLNTYFECAYTYDDIDDLLFASLQCTAPALRINL